MAESRTFEPRNKSLSTVIPDGPNRIKSRVKFKCDNSIIAHVRGDVITEF